MSTTTSTFVSHQGLQSCLDPFLLQPRVIFHQLSPQTPPPPLSTLPFPKKQPETPLEKIPETDKNYVHPLIKNLSTSSSCLSLKSLEMCTESLGSETGSGIDLNIDELCYHIYDDDDDVLEKQSNDVARIENAKAKKGGGGNNFPPPLSSIAGGDGVQVQTHREGGRLVIKAFSFSSSATYFRAEREDGRLRLSLLKDSNFFESENDELEDEQVNGDELELCICEESDDDVDNDEEEEEEEEEEDSNGEFWKVGGVNGGGDQWSTSSRWCNGGTSSRKRLPSLPFCVAIS